MAADLTVNNIVFYLNTQRDISPLLNQESGPIVASKRSSLDCKKLITNAFSPQIPVSCTTEVEKIAEQFGFHSFFQLIKPFGDRIQHKFQIKDSQLTSKTADDFSLRFTRPLNDLLTVQEAQATSKAQILSHQSLEILISEYVQSVNQEIKKVDEIENNVLITLLRDSVYLKYFTKLLSSSNITPFEYINHPVASFIVFSANETYEKARELLISFKSTKIPEFFDIDDILPIFIIIYDEKDEEQEKKALQLKEHVKRQLAVDGFVLPLSFTLDDDQVTFNPPLFLSVDEELQSEHLFHSQTTRFPKSNVTAIFKLLKEVTQKKIIPFMEQKVATWDEQVIAPRKSITGRFFNVSRKYFGGSKAQTSEHQNNYNQQQGYYRSQALEALTRKLADWSFMLRDYRYAYTTYELSKKDFLSDKAWTYLASTQEMSAISLLMGATNITSKLRNETIDPLIDSASYTYLSRCGYKTYALRLSLIVSELFLTLRDGWSSSPAALKWMRKALDDKLVGRAGKSLLKQRISYAYSLYISSQAKIILSKRLIKNEPEVAHDPNSEINPIKLPKKDMEIIGFTNKRKAALWSLIAAKDWDPVLQPSQVHFCLADASPVYSNLIVGQRESSLFRKLNDLTKIEQIK